MFSDISVLAHFYKKGMITCFMSIYCCHMQKRSNILASCSEVKKTNKLLYKAMLTNQHSH